jgi:pimeloyl-ACP methyl ester carboxylesterase
LAAGPQNSVYLAIASLPLDTAAVRLYRIDPTAEGEGNYSFDTNIDIAVSSATNGLYLLPPSITSNPVDSYGSSNYTWQIQIVSNTGETNQPEEIAESFASGVGYFGMEPPYVDGRVQLKQNLIFLLRAGLPENAFQYMTDPDFLQVYTNPTNYAYAGFIQSPFNSAYAGVFDSLIPFENNYFYRNFVFSLSDVDDTGRMATGIDDVDYESAEYFTINNSPTYQFQGSMISGTNAPALLATNETRWLASSPLDFYGSDIGIWSYSDEGNSFLAMTNDLQNLFGLSFLSAGIAWGNASDSTNVLLAGGDIEDNAGGYTYPETAQPQFQTVEYDFWQESLNYGGGFAATVDAVPGNPSFSTTNSSRQFFTSPGSPIQIAGYAKLAVQNGYPGIYAYLGQYFDQAYEIGTNGVSTTTTTGVLSPYGSFFPTQPGPVALVTMPDVDTGLPGTGVVYCVSMNVDKNHDGNMDLSFNGPDITSQASPMEFWINNDNDGTGIGEEIEAPQSPDSANDVIQSLRDLEDYTRLWICGMPSIDSLGGYQVTLSWTNVSSGNPAIKLFLSQEADGGTGYLTDTNIAQTYVGNVLTDSSFGTVSNNAPFAFPDLFFDNMGTKHFIFEGVNAGAGELVMTISQNGNTIAQTGVWLDLHDVRDLYERAVITNNITGAVSNWTSGIETIQQATVTNPNEDTNVIVYVHGGANGVNDWLVRSDTVFKRLYWAGYNGKLATVRWPSPTKLQIAQYRLEWFNESEAIAYKAASSLNNYLNQLQSRLPNYNINLLPQSLGGAVVSEALKEGAPFNNLILLDIAMPASGYDVNAPTNAELLAAEGVISTTPDWQPWGYQGVYTNVMGNIINYFNANDDFLNDWIFNQDHFKAVNPPYTYDGTNSYNSGVLISDSEESRAFVARSRAIAIGEQGPATGATGQGIIGSAIDLHAQFNVGSSGDEHSAFFTRPIQTVRPLYQQILRNYLIQPAP